MSSSRSIFHGSGSSEDSCASHSHLYFLLFDFSVEAADKEKVSSHSNVLEGLEDDSSDVISSSVAGS